MINTMKDMLNALGLGLKYFITAFLFIVAVILTLFFMSKSIFWYVLVSGVGILFVLFCVIMYFEKKKIEHTFMERELLEKERDRVKYTIIK